MSPSPATERFEDRLLTQLREVVADQPAPATTPRSRRSPVLAGARSRLVLAGAAIAALVATFVVAGGGNPAPAYGVETHADGSVTVQIHSLRDADGLERKLRAAGVPAVVDYLPPGKTCREPRFRPAAGPRSSGRTSTETRRGEGGVTTFTISRGELRPGETLVITSTVGTFSSLGMAIAAGPVAPCEQIDVPAGKLPPPPPGGGGPGAGTTFRTG
jgi:hypothetical protein